MDLTSEIIQKDLIGKVFKVKGLSWKFSNRRPEKTVVKIKNFTTEGEFLHVNVELDCHLC